MLKRHILLSIICVATACNTFDKQSSEEAHDEISDQEPSSTNLLSCSELRKPTRYKKYIPAGVRYIEYVRPPSMVGNIRTFEYRYDFARSHLSVSYSGGSGPQKTAEKNLSAGEKSDLEQKIRTLTCRTRSGGIPCNQGCKGDDGNIQKVFSDHCGGGDKISYSEKDYDAAKPVRADGVCTGNIEPDLFHEAAKTIETLLPIP